MWFLNQEGLSKGAASAREPGTPSLGRRELGSTLFQRRVPPGRQALCPGVGIVPAVLGGR